MCRKFPLFQEIKKIQRVTIYTLLITSYPQVDQPAKSIFLRRSAATFVPGVISILLIYIYIMTSESQSSVVLRVWITIFKQARIDAPISSRQ